MKSPLWPSKFASFVFDFLTPLDAFLAFKPRNSILMLFSEKRVFGSEILCFSALESFGDLKISSIEYHNLDFEILRKFVILFRIFGLIFRIFAFLTPILTILVRIFGVIFRIFEFLTRTSTILVRIFGILNQILSLSTSKLRKYNM